MLAVDLKNQTRDEAVAFAASLGESAYRGAQLWRWVHGRGVGSFAAMTDLAKSLRSRLPEVATVGELKVAEVQQARDGTRKVRLETHDGRSIESVLIPDGDKLTQCISTQVGCAMDCDFCATAKLKLSRSLSAGEIVDQVYRAQAILAADGEGKRITNLVYMGMGEPLHNFTEVMRSIRMLCDDHGAKLSPRKITVSTVGLVPAIDKLGLEPIRPNLAVSLNASTDEVRDRIMPVNRKWPIAELLAALRRYPLANRQRVTIEYVLLAGVNDTMADADRLARLLRGLPCKVNIIPWNPHAGASYQRPSEDAVDAFQRRLRDHDLGVYLRTPRGDDIDAACGQLANRTELVALASGRQAVASTS